MSSPIEDPDPDALMHPLSDDMTADIEADASADEPAETDETDEDDKMAKFHGTVRRNDLEGGFWELVGDDGTTYQLSTSDRSLTSSGVRVEIEGKVKKDEMGFGMTGPILEVKAWKKA